MTATPFVSVIVPCLDAEAWIGACLAAVRANDYPMDRVELIVVDNGSRDRTLEIARSHTALIHVIPDVTISALRNSGVSNARGEVLAFLDADCVPSPNWLREGVRSLQTDLCVCGYVYGLPEGASWIERTWFAQRDPGRCETREIPGGNLFVERETFERIGGFDESLRTGEDAEFCRRARRFAKVISDDRIQVVHLGNPKTIRDFVRREIWHGLGAFGSYRLDKFDRPLLGTFAFLLCTAGQFAGLILWITGRSSFLLGVSTLALLALLSATVFYRRRFVASAGESLRLAGLYYFYFLGRSLSFYFLATDRPYSRRSRS
jgi:glycosyltransferase involved in cell wall biosynthesis